MLEQMLLATLVTIGGSIISHSAIWYRIGKLEKAVYNGNSTSKKIKR